MEVNTTTCGSFYGVGIVNKPVNFTRNDHLFVGPMVISRRVRAHATSSLLAIVLAGGATSAWASVAATRTTAPSPYVAIHVTVSDSKVVLSPTSEPRGVIARFIVDNAGMKPVTFNVGSETEDRTKGFGFTEVVGPGQRRVRLLYLALRGRLPFYVGSSYSGAKANLRGALQVGAPCNGCAKSGAMPTP
jgi:hypothetical protein